jgi:hypothetical protein
MASRTSEAVAGRAVAEAGTSPSSAAKLVYSPRIGIPRIDQDTALVQDALGCETIGRVDRDPDTERSVASPLVVYEPVEVFAAAAVEREP